MRKTIRGSIVGTRNDCAESPAFAAEGKAASQYATDALDTIHGIVDPMVRGAIDGRIVMEM